MSSPLWQIADPGEARDLVRLPSGAWPIVAGALARRAAAGGRSLLVLIRPHA